MRAAQLTISTAQGLKKPKEGRACFKLPSIVARQRRQQDPEAGGHVESSQATEEDEWMPVLGFLRVMQSGAHCARDGLAHSKDS